MPDILPVRLQDKLRYRKPELRKQGKQVIKLHLAKNAAVLAAFLITFSLLKRESNQREKISRGIFDINKLLVSLKFPVWSA